MSADDDPDLVYGKPLAFTATPKITLGEVQTAYGDPTGTKSFPDGYVVACYGRLALVTRKDASTVEMVIFRPDVQIRIKGEQ